MIRAFALLLALIAGLATAPASAHFTPNSVIELDFASDHVRAQITIPTNEIAFATGRPVMSLPELARHLSATSPDGKVWQVLPKAVRTDTLQKQTDLIATFDLVPPPGADLRQLTLRYNAVIDRVPSHMVMVFARSDFAGGILQSEPQLIGALQQDRQALLIDRGTGSGWRGFGAAIRLGMHHIAEGHDHLLFLLTLLLPAPLLAAGRRWNGYGGLRSMARKLATIVTAFTIGHSLTLIGGAFLGWRLTAQPVEIGIALSILVSAIHAWRPIFAGKEALVAGGFGLIHGLAFATIIGDFTIEPLYRAQAILGFNVGIEIVQLAVVAVMLPALVVLGQSTAYPRIRSAGALLSGIAATAWAIERILGKDNAAARAIDAGLGYAIWPLGLASLACLAVIVLRQSRWAGKYASSI